MASSGALHQALLWAADGAAGSSSGERVESVFDGAQPPTANSASSSGLGSSAPESIEEILRRHGYDALSPESLSKVAVVTDVVTELVKRIGNADSQTLEACCDLERLIESLPKVNMLTLGKGQGFAAAAAVDLVFRGLIPLIDPQNIRAVVRLLEILYLKYVGVFPSMTAKSDYRDVKFFPRGIFVDKDRDPPIKYFSTGRLLGRGSYGQVYYGYDVRTGIATAIKRISIPPVAAFPRDPSKRDRMMRHLHQEIETMSALRHPNIVRMYEVEPDPKGDESTCYVMMEYCGGGDVKQYVKGRGGGLSLSEVVRYTRQLAKGLRVLWLLRIIHRDLKPDNLLLSESGNLKIADFGFARFARESEELYYTCVGTFCYVAPEIVEKGMYTRKSDLWSVGCILYEFLTGQMRFNGKKREEVRLQWRQPHTYPEKCDADDSFKGLISGLLEVDENARLSWEEFFAHPCVNLSSDGEAERDEEGVASSFHSLLRTSRQGVPTVKVVGKDSQACFEEDLAAAYVTPEDVDDLRRSLKAKECLGKYENEPDGGEDALEGDNLDCAEVESGSMDPEEERLARALCQLLQEHIDREKRRIKGLHEEEAVAGTHVRKLRENLTTLRSSVEDVKTSLNCAGLEMGGVAEGPGEGPDPCQIEELKQKKDKLQAMLHELEGEVHARLDGDYPTLSSGEIKDIRRKEEERWAKESISMDTKRHAEMAQLQRCNSEMLEEKSKLQAAVHEQQDVIAEITKEIEEKRSILKAVQ